MDECKKPFNGKNYVVVEDPRAKLGYALGQWDDRRGAYFFHNGDLLNEFEVLDRYRGKAVFYDELELIEIIESVSTSRFC